MPADSPTDPRIVIHNYLSASLKGSDADAETIYRAIDAAYRLGVASASSADGSAMASETQWSTDGNASNDASRGRRGAARLPAEQSVAPAKGIEGAVLNSRGAQPHGSGEAPQRANDLSASPPAIARQTTEQNGAGSLPAMLGSVNSDQTCGDKQYRLPDQAEDSQRNALGAGFTSPKTAADVEIDPLDSICARITAGTEPQAPSPSEPPVVKFASPIGAISSRVSQVEGAMHLGTSGAFQPAPEARAHNNNRAKWCRIATCHARFGQQ